MSLLIGFLSFVSGISVGMLVARFLIVRKPGQVGLRRA